METKDVLKQLRKSREKTMQELCKEANLNFGTYQNYETGKRTPTAEILIKLADFYGVTTDYLLGRNTETADPMDMLSSIYNIRPIERHILEWYLSLDEKKRGELVGTLEKIVKT